MTNHLVGDVYERIIDEVVDASRADFEENGVTQQTLEELKREWQSKLSQRNVAQMPWDPKPAPPAPAQPAQPANANGMSPQQSYPGYENTQPAANGQNRIKTEPNEQYNNLPPLSAYQQAGGPQGGSARAAQLMQQNFGPQANASISTMQSRGLALPGQQQQSKPSSLQLPPGSVAHQQYAEQQRRMAQAQAQQLRQQQQQPNIKVEGGGSGMGQSGYQQPQQPSYAQTDGTDDDLAAWKAMLAQRRAEFAEQGLSKDHMMRDRIMEVMGRLNSGLMVPLEEQSVVRKRRAVLASAPSKPRVTAAGNNTVVPQLDGDVDDEDEKINIKDEEDEDAINSDLDDPDDDPVGGADDEDDLLDSILCTYDKVQRVKNKWKCTLKDGVLNTNKKEYLFHKAQGEFEW